MEYIIKKTILTITGPTGSGKTELLRILCENYPIAKMVTTTTREPRPGEVSGVDYNFVSERWFQGMVDSGGFIEHTTFEGNYYGTSANECQRILDSGKTPAVILDPNGVVSFRRYGDSQVFDVCSTYIEAAPHTLMTRYLGRLVGETLTEERVKYHARRMSSLLNEYDTWKSDALYDFIVYNGGSLEDLRTRAEDIYNQI